MSLFTPQDLSECVGGFVRIKPQRGNQSAQHFHGAKLLAIHGKTAIVKPAGHRREDTVSIDDIVPWKSQNGHRGGKLKPATTEWVIGDARLPRYYNGSGNDPWTGNPAEAQTFSGGGAAMAEAQRLMRNTKGGPKELYPLPLSAALEQYDLRELAKQPQPEAPTVEVVAHTLPAPAAPQATPEEFLASLLSKQQEALAERRVAEEAVREAQKVVDIAKAHLDQKDAAVREATDTVRVWGQKINEAVGASRGQYTPVSRRASDSTGAFITTCLAHTTVGETYGIPEVVKILKANGWRTESTSWSQRVSCLLNYHTHIWEKVQRGQFKRIAATP